MAVANGRLSTAQLGDIPARYYSWGETAHLQKDAAASFLRIAALFEAEFGKTLVCISFYRDLDRQIAIFRERYVRVSRARRPGTTDRSFQGSTWALKPGYAPVASPGYSNHGLGLAVDFNAGVQNSGSAENAWFRQTAPAYGWDHTEGASVGEAWHWVYFASKDRHRGETSAVGPVVVAQTLAARAIQTNLSALGYDPGAIDGIAGSKTRLAVQQYQADAALAVDGIPGQQTISHLEDDMTKLDDITRTLARHSQILEAVDVRTGNTKTGRLALAAEATLGRQSQILEAVDVRTGNPAKGELRQAADRTLGVLPAQRAQLVEEIAAAVVAKLGK